MRRLNRRGMTLIEVVVALAIFGIVMVTIFPAVLVLNLMNTFSFERLDTAFIAQEAMEEIIFESRDNSRIGIRDYIVNQMGYTLISSNPNFEFEFQEANYTITITLTQINSTSLHTLLIIVSSSTTGNIDISGDRTQLETIVSLRLN